MPWIRVWPSNLQIEAERLSCNRFFSTKGTKGTGLGLMISKKIIDDHKGNIHVDPEKDKESKFIIRLPGKDQVVDKSKFDESKPV